MRSWSARGGKVFAFEPDPTNFAILKKNVEINGYKNVVLVQKAVSDKAGKLRLYRCEDNPGDHRIYDSHDNRKSIEIGCIRLDDYLRAHGNKIDFIKMDIQGAEGRACLGMMKLLKKNKSLKLVSEFWPAGLKRAGTEPSEYLEMLLSLGFRIYEANEKKKELAPISAAKLVEAYPVTNEDYTTLVCMRDLAIE